jgi:ribosomal protein L11 methyltransferase
MPVTRVEILAQRGSDEILDAALYTMCNGIWIEDRGEQVLIRCYPRETTTFLAHVRRSMPSVVMVTAVDEAEIDYVGLVRRHFTPVRIGDLTILPPWRKTDRKGKTIIIEPGMAFGTGRHESTKIMIRLMGRLELAGKRVLDIGSGSGILALYAWRLGAASVAAIDHDPLAAEAIRKGCELNRCDRIFYACSDIEGVRGRFPVVLANLDFDTFVRHGKAVTEKIEDGGYLVVSGIEAQYSGQIPYLFRGLALFRKARMEDWRGFIFRLGDDKCGKRATGRGRYETRGPFETEER